MKWYKALYTVAVALLTVYFLGEVFFDDLPQEFHLLLVAGIAGIVLRIIKGHSYEIH